MDDTILRVFIVAATVSLAIGIWKEGVEKGWYEGLSIYFAVFVIVSITATNDYMKNKQFRKLMDVRKDSKILVTRLGHTTEISKFALLVGDIVQL